MEDNDLLEQANIAQKKIEDSGISLLSIEVEDQEVLSAINRVFGTSSNEITFDMFKESVRLLYRAGLINGYSRV